MIKFTTKEAEKNAKNLLKAFASKDSNVSKHAQETLAALMTTPMSVAVEQASLTSLIYGEPIRYTRADGPPSIPLDIYFGLPEGYFQVWSNGSPGGLATNHISGEDEFRFSPISLDSAVSWLIDYAESGAVNTVTRGIQRMLQEVLVKRNYYGWEVLLTSIGKAVYGGQRNVIASTAKTQGATRKFQLDDVSRMITKLQRLNASWVGGTPIGNESARGLTDLFVSPEAMEEVRRFVYNPMNTTAIPDTNESTALGLPDGIRTDIYNNGGAASLFGIRLHTLWELGVGGAYTNLLDSVYTPAGSDATFNAGSEDVVIGVNLRANAFARVVMEDEENGDIFNLEVDDQFTRRSKRFGYFGGVTDGYMVGNDRAAIALVW